MNLNDIINEIIDELSVKIMSAQEFESKGGLSISTGLGGKLYTLRSDQWDTIGVYDGAYGQKTSMPIRRSYHIRNLGKDWDEVKEKLPQVLKSIGMAGQKVYLSGFSGKLLPNSAPVPVVIPNKFWFGKYSGKSIDEVGKEDIKYLIWVATNFKSNNKKMMGFIQKIREMFSTDIDKYVKAQEKEQKEEAKAQAKRTARYSELISVLKSKITYSSGFIDSIINDLERGFTPVGKGGKILQDIYAKTFGRSNSKAYKKAYDDFFTKFVKGDEKDWRW